MLHLSLNAEHILKSIYKVNSQAFKNTSLDTPEL